MKNTKNRILLAGCVLCAIVALVSTVTAVRMYRTVRAFEKSTGFKVFSLEKRPVDEGTHEQDAASVTAITNDAPRGMRTERVAYDKDSRIELTLSERPDMTEIHRFVSAAPMKSGRIAVSYSLLWNDERRTDEHTLIVTGDFAYRTNVALRVHAGLGCRREKSYDDIPPALAVDYTYVFQRKDLDGMRIQV